jgi:hypothetical protein
VSNSCLVAVNEIELPADSKAAYELILNMMSGMMPQVREGLKPDAGVAMFPAVMFARWLANPSANVSHPLTVQ